MSVGYMSTKQRTKCTKYMNILPTKRGNVIEKQENKIYANVFA